MQYGNRAAIVLKVVLVVLAHAGLLSGTNLLADDDDAAAATRFDCRDSALRIHRLSNGVVVLVSHHPIENEYFAVLHRFGLLDDARGESQWTHLLEHLAVRVTDSSASKTDLPLREGVPAGTISVNGETSGHLLRLEAIFPSTDPRRLEDVFSRASAWTRFEVAVAHSAFEATRAIGEVDFTERSGALHKWALVAWNQAARGATRVELRDALSSARPEELAAAATRFRTCEPPVLLFHGGLDPKTAIEFASSIPVWAPTDARPVEPIVSPPRTGTRIEWDLKTTAIVGVCEIPAETPRERLAGILAAEVLIPVMANGRHGREATRAMIGFEAGTGVAGDRKGRLFITATVADGVPAERAIKAIQATLSALRTENTDDIESLVDRFEGTRDRCFDVRANLRHGGLLGASTPYDGMQAALEAAQLRIQLDAYDHDAVCQAFGSLDCEATATEFVDALAEDRWHWLTIEPKP